MVQEIIKTLQKKVLTPLTNWIKWLQQSPKQDLLKPYNQHYLPQIIRQNKDLALSCSSLKIAKPQHL